MPKIVVMNKEVQKGVMIRNFMAGGAEAIDKELWIGDNLKDFPYFNPDEKKIEVTSAKLIDVKMSPITTSSKPGENAAGPEDPNKNSVIAKMKVDSITIDASSYLQSKIVTVPQSSILEYAHGDNQADDAIALPLIRLKLDMLLSDNHTQSIMVEEGDIFSALIYKTTPSPKIIVGRFTVKGYVFDSKYDVIGLVLDDGNKLANVLLTDIKYFGTEATMLSDMSGAKEALEKSKESSGVPTIVGFSEPGVISEEALDVGNVVQISGVKVGIPANTGDRANDTIDEKSENVIKKKLTCEKGTDLVLDGVSLTGEAIIECKDDPKSVDVENCKFAELTPTSSRDYLIRSEGTWDGTKVRDNQAVRVVVDGCYFGSANNDTNKIYNVIEIYRPWADGSSVSNNRFAGTCTNNYINIYNMEDGATINLENNSVDDGIAFCRIAASGSPKNVTINIKNTKYDELDLTCHESTDTYGLVTIQPNSEIVDMSGVRINIDGTEAPDKKPEHLYSIILADNYKTAFTAVHYPEVYVNGKKQTSPHVIDMTSK